MSGDFRQVPNASSIMRMTHSDPSAEEVFGAQVRLAREARQWTQEALARHLRETSGIGMDQAAVARLEGGKRSIRLNEASALAKLLGLDLQALSGVVPRLTAEEYEEAKKKLAEATAEEATCAAELRKLEVTVSELQRDRRHWSTELWRYGQMIAEYEARNGE
jgi:transcriptional regulator with XRE-family HTH domain